jgi:hypothetical protein
MGRGGKKIVAGAFEHSAIAFAPEWQPIEHAAGVAFPDDQRSKIQTIVADYLIMLSGERSASPASEVEAALARLHAGANEIIRGLSGRKDADFAAAQAIDREFAKAAFVKMTELDLSTEGIVDQMSALIVACISARSSLGERYAYNSAWYRFVGNMDTWASAFGFKAEWSHENKPSAYVSLIDAIMRQVPESHRRQYNSVMPALGQQIREARRKVKTR